MSWKHRVLVHFQEGDTEPYFMIHEVHYDENRVPNGYSWEAVKLGSEELKGLKWTLNKMKECLTKPILYAGDRFPEEYSSGTVSNSCMPLYVKMGSVCLRMRENVYYRDAGDWEVGFKYKDNKLVSVSNESAHMDGNDLIKCSEEEWRENNAGYIFDSTKAYRKSKDVGDTNELIF